jgi:hypothetical protein
MRKRRNSGIGQLSSGTRTNGFRTVYGGVETIEGYGTALCAVKNVG